MSDALNWLSGTALARRLNVPTREVFRMFAEHGWIERKGEHWRLTGKGEFEGGRYQSSERFGTWIVWPESLLQHRLFAADPEHALLSSAMLGDRFGLSARQTSLLLHELGWMRRAVRGWELTPRGKALGGVQEEYPDSGVPFVRWPAALLKNRVLLQNLRVVQALERVGEAHEGDLFADPEAELRVDAGGRDAHRALDGHVLLSRAHLMICHWLYMSGIVHAAGRRLPVEGEYRCDFYLPELQLYIEYWGDETEPGQLSAKLARRTVYERNGLALLELDAEELPRLDEVLPRKLLKYGLAVY